MNPKKSVLRAITFSRNNSCCMLEYWFTHRSDGMYRYYCSCSFNKITQFMNTGICWWVIRSAIIDQAFLIVERSQELAGHNCSRKFSVSKSHQCEWKVCKLSIQWHPVPSFLRWVNMMFLNAHWQCAFFTMQSNMDATIMMLWTESRFVWSRFVIKHTIEGTPICDVASRVAEAMFTELTLHAATDVIKPGVILSRVYPGFPGLHVSVHNFLSRKTKQKKSMKEN